jgi:hypothetical protein
MAADQPLSREAFTTLAAASGIDVSGDHGDELFDFVLATLAGLGSLKNIDVSGAEPDMAFKPAGE